MFKAKGLDEFTKIRTEKRSGWPRVERALQNEEFREKRSQGEKKKQWERSKDEEGKILKLYDAFYQALGKVLKRIK